MGVPAAVVCMRTRSASISCRSLMSCQGVLGSACIAGFTDQIILVLPERQPTRATGVLDAVLVVNSVAINSKSVTRAYGQPSSLAYSAAKPRTGAFRCQRPRMHRG
jgi:hypothetical protein